MSILSVPYDEEVAKRVYAEEQVERARLEMALRMLSYGDYDLDYVLKIFKWTKEEFEKIIWSHLSEWELKEYEYIPTLKKHKLKYRKPNLPRVRVDIVSKKLLDMGLSKEQISEVIGMEFISIEDFEENWSRSI